MVCASVAQRGKFVTAGLFSNAREWLSKLRFKRCALLLANLL